MDKRQETIELLKEYNQEHIINYLKKMNDEDANKLIEQIQKIDFHQITELYNNTKKTIEFKESKIEPLKYLDKEMIFLAPEDAIQFLALIILVALSAFFSSAETALTTVNRIRLQAMAEDGSKAAAKVLKTIENSSKMLSAILIGNNLVNNFIASIATALAIKFMGNGSVGFVTGVVTIIVLIFGEITPKTFATVNSEKLSLAYATFILLLMKLLTPVIVIINFICRSILKFLHVDADSSLNTMTEMELRTIVDVSHKD